MSNYLTPEELNNLLNNCTNPKWRMELFLYMANAHGVDLTDSDIDNIVAIIFNNIRIKAVFKRLIELDKEIESTIPK